MTKSVLIATPYFPPHLGGVEQYAANIGIRLQEQFGWRVVIVTSGESGSLSPQIQDGLTVYRLPIDLTVSNTPIGFAWRKQLGRIIRDEQVDLINAHLPVPSQAMAAALAKHKTPMVLTYHAIGSRIVDPRSAAMRLFEVTMLPWLARRSAHVLTSSRAVVRDFNRSFGHKSTVVSPGVDPKLFAPTPVPDNQRVLFVGSLMRATAYKNLALLLDVMADVVRTLPAATLEVVGDGNMIDAYKDQATKSGLGDKVVFAGAQFGEQLAQAYERANVIVTPSSYDSFPTVIVEAMATGRPVVATTVGGIPDLVDDDQTGLLVTPNDKAALAAALVGVLSDHEWASAFGQAGRLKVENGLSWDDRARQTDHAFNAVLEQSRSSKPRLAQVSAFYPPNLGGVEKVVQLLAHELSSTNDVTVLTTNVGAEGAPGVSRDQNVLVRRARAMLLPGTHTAVSPGLFWNLLRLPANTIVHAHVAQPILPEMVWLSSRLRRRRYILHFHLDVDAHGFFGRLLPLYKKLFTARSLRSAECVVALSRPQADALIANYGVAPDRVFVVHNAVDDDFFMPTRSERIVDATHPLRLLFVGRLGVQKNVGRLIDALALTTAPVQLTVVGSGEQEPALRSQIARLQLNNVSLIGPKTGEELMSQYRSADAFVLPSDKEGMPLVLLEAMAASLPVVATDVDGCRELVSGVGLLAEPTPAALARAIDQLADSALRTQLAGQSRRRADEFSKSSLISAIEGLYSAGQASR